MARIIWVFIKINNFMRRKYKKNGYTTYTSVASLSYLVRSFYLPNPFENYEWGIIINLVVGAALYPITFKVVGLFYKRGYAPVLGSILYLLFYTIHTGLLVLLSKFDFKVIPVTIISVVYIGLLRFIYEKLNDPSMMFR